MSDDSCVLVSETPEPQPSNPPQSDPRPATGPKQTPARHASDPWDDILGEAEPSALVREFLRRCLYALPGASVGLKELYAAFLHWLPECTRADWTLKRFSAALPPCLPKGRPPGQNLTHVGNISVSPAEPWAPDRSPLILSKGYALVPADGSRPHRKSSRKRGLTFVERIAEYERLAARRRQLFPQKGANAVSPRSGIAG